MAGGVVQVVENLPSKPETLNSNPSTGKKKLYSLNLTKQKYTHLTFSFLFCFRGLARQLHSTVSS
jgi:hypothetical protein